MASIPTHFLPTRLEMGFTGYGLSHYIFRPAPEFPPELLLDPDLWVHVTGKLKVDHEVLVLAQDGAFEAHLRVTGIDPRGLWATMRLLRDWPAGVVAESAKMAGLPTAPAMQSPRSAGVPDKDGYLIEFSGPQRWRIVRGGDVVATDLPNEAAAVAMLADIKAEKPAKRAAA